MAQSEKELEKQLVEAGNKLLSPPSSVSELMTLLDQVDGFLTRVEQSPSESMNKALSPSIKAIVADSLLKHSSDDVKVVVASCVSEITRITAPDAPYDDEQMKDVFQLIVSSFEKIDDQSSPSYDKGTHILETVAKVRSCVVMLDLECDDLILEMFQNFLRSIRDHHPENVFSSMETIMTLVLEESEDGSLDLVSSILDFLKTENKEALPIAVRLAEKVIEKCASKLKPHLIPAVESRGTSLNDYSKVVANVCQAPPEAVEPIDGDAARKKLTPLPKSTERSSKEESDVYKASKTSSKRKWSSGKEKVESEIPQSMEDIVRKKKKDEKTPLPKSTERSSKEESDVHKASKTSSKRKRSSGKEKVESEIPQSMEDIVRKKKKDEKVLVMDHAGIATQSSGRTKDHGEELVGSKIKVWWPVDQKFYYGVVQSFDSVKMRHKVVYDDGDVEYMILTKEKWKLIEGDTMSDQSFGGTKDHGQELVGSKIKVWRPGDPKFYYAVVDSFDSVNMKHKVFYYDGYVENLTLAKEKWKLIEGDAMSDQSSGGTTDHGEELVGSKIKVWWPGDQKFYYAVVESFDSVNMKHKVFYYDGYVEKLTLAKEKWKLIEGDAMSDQSSGGFKDHGEELVGSKIKVWWSGDQKFYYAVVESFDSVNMKHKVFYYDGYVEKLTLAKEKWKLIEGDAMSDQSSGGTKDHGEELVGSKIKVWWSGDQKFYYAVVESFDSVNMKHKVFYYDGYVEKLSLANEKWKLIEGDAMSDQEECTSDGESPNGISEMPKGKKVKTGEDLRTKHGKVEATPGTNTKPKSSSPKGKGAEEKDKSSSEAPETDAKQKSPIQWKIQKKRKRGGKGSVIFLPPVCF